jgi:uncharacterized protein involved in exopolysaccharide biosynthesis
MTEAAPPKEFSLLDLLAIVLRHRRLIAGITVAWVLVMVVPLLLRDRTYTARTAFVPQAGSGNAGKLAGLAAQFGVNVGGGGDDVTQSPEFYEDLVRSDFMLRRLVEGPYELGGGDSGSLLAILEVDEEDPRLALDVGVAAFRPRLSIQTGLKTSIVQISVRLEDPVVARSVVQRALDLVTEFNLTTRQSQARQEHRFVEGRLEMVRNDLREAEDRLQGFLQRNRDYRFSPQLNFEHDRLEREVEVRQQVYTSLAQSVQQAQIDAVRNTPVISVVQPPMVPVRPDPRRLPVRGMLAIIVGMMIGIGIAFGLEFFRENRERAPDLVGEVRGLWGDTRADLARIFRFGRSG